CRGAPGSAPAREGATPGGGGCAAAHRARSAGSGRAVRARAIVGRGRCGDQRAHRGAVAGGARGGLRASHASADARDAAARESTRPRGDVPARPRAPKGAHMTRIGPLTSKIFRVAERRQRAFDRAVASDGWVAPRARALWWLVGWSRKLGNVEVAA